VLVPASRGMNGMNGRQMPIVRSRVRGMISRWREPERRPRRCNALQSKGLTSKGLCDIRPHVKGPHAKRPQWVRQNPSDLASATKGRRDKRPQKINEIS